jgi:hypothetical protein
MKIHDIISDEPLNETGAGLIARGASKLLGPAAEKIASLFGKGQIGRATEELARRIAQGEKFELATVEKMVGKESAKDVLKAAEKKGASLKRTATWNANIAGIGETAKSVKAWTGKLINAGLTGAYYWLLYEPLKLYMDNIEEAEAMLKNGKATPEEFEQYRQREMSALIGKWAALWATGKLARLPFAVVGKVMGAFSPSLGKVMGTLGTAGQVYFMNQVNSPENAQAIAEFMAGPIATKFIGGIGVEAENKIRKWIPFAHEYDNKGTNDSTGTNADKKDTTPVDPDAPPKADAEPTVTDVPAAPKPQATPRDKWIYYSPGMIQDPVTKAIDYK